MNDDDMAAICGTDEALASWMCQGQHPEMQKVIRRTILGEKKFTVNISIETCESGGMADALG